MYYIMNEIIKCKYDCFNASSLRFKICPSTQQIEDFLDCVVSIKQFICVDCVRLTSMTHNCFTSVWHSQRNSNQEPLHLITHLYCISIRHLSQPLIIEQLSIIDVREVSVKAKVLQTGKTENSWEKCFGLFQLREPYELNICPRFNLQHK